MYMLYLFHKIAFCSKNDIGVLKEQLTPATSPLLLSQEHSLDAIAGGMYFESLAPGEQVAIVRAGCSLDFDVSLDLCLSVFPQRHLLVLKLPTLSFIHMPVFVRDPMPSQQGMAALRPPFSLEIEQMVTSRKRL
jgi:hypothetical protein